MERAQKHIKLSGHLRCDSQRVESDQVLHENSLLKKALVRLIQLPERASLEDKKRAIGNPTLEILSKMKSDFTRLNKAFNGIPAGNIDKISEGAHRIEKEEEVRQRLRDANTAESIEEAIRLARELDMSFEIVLGERKLSKFVTVPVSSRE